MQKILLIETSPTQRHALGKSIEAHGFSVNSLSEFTEAITQLSEMGGIEAYDGIVMGWPNQTLEQTDEFLATLEMSQYSQLPVLVLAHEADSAKLAWVSSRQQTAFLLWDNYPEAGLSLKYLLSKNNTVEIDDSLRDVSMRILLVDDSPTARVKFRRILDKVGYQVDAVSSAEEALQVVEKNNYDIAIIDYFMPEMNGDELCRTLSKNPQSQHIILSILTSSYNDKVISDSLSAGAVECMFKSESSELFLARIASMGRSISITKRIERERARLEGILHSVGDGVYGVDKDGFITFVNPAVKKMLGYINDDELIGQSSIETFHQISSENEEQKFSTSYLEQAISEGREMHEVEAIFKHLNGVPIQVEMTIYPSFVNGEQEGAVVAFRDVSARKLLEEELKWQASHDQLTKLLNRKYLEDALETEVKRLERSDEESALLYIDLDRFKYINDTIGHAAGDALLIEISNLLHSRLRSADLLARIGGDEFSILLRNVDLEHLFEIADDYRKLLEQYTFHYDGGDYNINGSIGVANMNKTSSSHGEIMANADIACHIAKGKGRNQIHVYSQEQDDKAAMEIELGWSTRLHNALDNDSFELYYQPIVALNEIDTHNLPEQQDELWGGLLKNNSIKEVLYEVLIRLPNSNGDLVAPGAFLPTAERFNMMQEIDSWVVNQALKTLGKINSNGASVSFSINLSGQSMENDDLLQDIKNGIKKWELDPACILLEITETCAINRMEEANHFIEELHALGCNFALDDFGSGYSSFNHLKNLHVDLIKIDGQFIKDIVHDPMDLAIVTSINNIAHSLGKKTVAEFVEDADTLRLLKQAGIDYVQGYYVSLPISTIDTGDNLDNTLLAN
jgi:diguanylate cyclase (GGDEF)-like protein/PAS domain S-box-containing protein